MNPDLLRPLGRMETALTWTDEFAPLNLVGVVAVAGGPTPQALRRALDAVQARRPLLGARLGAHGSRRFFQPAGERPIPLRVVERLGDDHWRAVAEAELNERLPAADGPLLRAVHVYGAGPHSEIILSAHHAILDAAGALSLWDELLARCGDAAPSLSAGRGAHRRAFPPPAEALYPPHRRGLGWALRLLSFAARQAGDELHYRRVARGTPAPVINLKARGRIMPLRFQAPLTAALVRRCRAQRVTLNSALSAAMLLTVHRQRYDAAPTALRGLTFGNLRPYLKPPPAPDALGCYITMLRYTAACGPHSDFWAVARAINHRIYQAARRGDKFAAAWLSPLLVAASARLKSMRLAAAALSYAGVAGLRDRYGPLRVLGLHGFVSNHALGPEYTAAARLFRDELWWDALYLDTDMDAPAAQALGAGIRETLAAALG